MRLGIEVDPVERSRPVPGSWSDGRHNCHSLHVIVLNGAEHVLGPEGLADALRRAGEARSVEVLRDTTRWCSYETTIRLLEILVDALGGKEAFRTAACWFDPASVTDTAADVIAVFQSLGGPAGILRQVAEAASKFTTVATMETHEVSHDWGVVRLRMAPGFPPHPLLCEVVAGLLSVSPQLFGLPPAVVSHERCAARGDEECRFWVRWSDDAPAAVASALQVEQEVAVVRRRLDALRSTVVELVSGQDVDIVLDRIVERAARAVRAPSYLLAVRLADDEPARTHAIGLPHGSVDALAAELLDGPTWSSSASRLVVDIGSDRRFYGRLAAFGPDGIAFLDEERRTFDAYAALAAAALDSATAMAEVRRQAATAQALLDLAHAVSDVTTKEDVAARLVSAVPTVVGATIAGVLLHDRGRLVAAASHGLPHEAEILFDGFTVDLADAPRLRDTVEHGHPFVVATREADGLLRDLLTAAGANTTVLVPIHVGDQLYGVVSAGLQSHVDGIIPAGSDLINRLTGLAALAATAFRNAELLERLRHQSLHDPLTGAPNRRLLEDRVDRALAECRRSGVPAALLLLDLDHFKTVNDTLGHAAGDGILHRVVERLQRAVRQVDTVARFGGDEFAVLLPGLAHQADAATVAQKLLDALRSPFRIAGHAVTIDASVGIAVAPADGDTYPALLKAADTAMYSAKSAGRSTRRGRSATRPTP